MERYKNRSGNSGVVAYDAQGGAITVEFKGGKVYVYTYESTGRSTVERMKALAADGKGLSGFIAAHVGKAYADRLR